jgi:hypothetical protein
MARQRYYPTGLPRTDPLVHLYDLHYGLEDSLATIPQQKAAAAVATTSAVVTPSTGIPSTAQTPWTSDIDGATHELENVKALTLIPGSAPSNAAGKIRVNAAGNLDLSDAGSWRLAWHDVATGVGFQNSWTNFAAGIDASASYILDPLGFVTLRGILSGGASGTTAFTLPAGFRPPLQEGFAVTLANGSGVVGSGQVLVTASGVVQPQGFTTLQFLSISGIRFSVF